MKPITKPLLVLALAATMGVTATSSFARDNRAWAAAGAGFVAGAIVGAAAANSNAYYYDPYYGGYGAYAYDPYYGGRAYVAPAYPGYYSTPAWTNRSCSRDGGYGRTDDSSC